MSRGSERGTCTIATRQRAEGVGAGELDDEVEALVLDAREGLRRVETERASAPAGPRWRNSAATHACCASSSHLRRSMRMPAALERRQQLALSSGTARRPARCAAADRLAADRRRPCRRGRRASEPSSRRCFSPATRISKNSSRLVHEIVRNLTRSSSGTRVVLRLRQHAPVELEQRELAVDVELRRLERDFVHGRSTRHKKQARIPLRTLWRAAWLLTSTRQAAR